METIQYTCQICKRITERDSEDGELICEGQSGRCCLVVCEDCCRVCPESSIVTCEKCELAEREYWHAMYKAGKLTPPDRRQQRLDQMMKEDPVAFYINCKDNPDAIEMALEEEGL